MIENVEVREGEVPAWYAWVVLGGMFALALTAALNSGKQP